MPKIGQNLENASPTLAQPLSLRDTSNVLSTDNYIDLVKRLLPSEHKSCLFTVVALAHLIVGIIRFAQTGDIGMLNTLLYIVATYVGAIGIGTGVKELPSIISKFKEK